MSVEEGMTLVFTTDALRVLAAPADAIADAKTWSAYVGVAADASGGAEPLLDRTGADPDFLSTEGGLAGGLAAVRQQFTTDRHVVVGADDATKETAEALGWEYLPVRAAAENADWAVDA